MTKLQAWFGRVSLNYYRLRITLESSQVIHLHQNFA